MLEVQLLEVDLYPHQVFPIKMTMIQNLNLNTHFFQLVINLSHVEK